MFVNEHLLRLLAKVKTLEIKCSCVKIQKSTNERLKSACGTRDAVWPTLFKRGNEKVNVKRQTMLADDTVNLLRLFCTREN